MKYKLAKLLIILSSVNSANALTSISGTPEVNLTFNKSGTQLNSYQINITNATSNPFELGEVKLAHASIYLNECSNHKIMAEGEKNSSCSIEFKVNDNSCIHDLTFTLLSQEKKTSVVDQSINFCQTPTKSVSDLSYECIKNSLQSGVQTLKDLNRSGSIIIVNRDGSMKATYTMPQALPATFGFALSKARTSVALGIPSGEVSQMLPKDLAYNIASTQNGQYVMFPGGYPIRSNHKLIGGVACGATITDLDSNVPNPQTPNKDADDQCALAVLKTINSCSDMPS